MSVGEGSHLNNMLVLFQHCLYLQS